MSEPHGTLLKEKELFQIYPFQTLTGWEKIMIPVSEEETKSVSTLKVWLLENQFDDIYLYWIN